MTTGGQPMAGLSEDAPAGTDGEVATILDPLAQVIRLEARLPGGTAYVTLDEKGAAELATEIESRSQASRMLLFRFATSGFQTIVDLAGKTEVANDLRQAAIRLRAEKNEKARTEVWRALREHDHKYAYYKLTVAGAALVFALNETRQAHLSWAQLPLAAAVLTWGLSVAFGFSHLKHVRSVLLQDAGGQPLASADDAVRAGDRQLRFLVIGALLYVAWHVTEMYLRSRYPLAV